MSGQKLSLLFCCNADYELPALVAVLSAARHLPGDREAELAVIAHGLGAEFWRRLEQGVAFARGRLRIRQIPFPLERFEALPRPKWFSPVGFGRLLVGEIPFESERVLYLDSDTFTRAPLAPVLGTDLRGSVAGAVTDHFFPVMPDGIRERLNPPARSGHVPYFNSGVLLIDVSKWKSECITERVIQFANNHPEQCPFGDQCALNFALFSKWREMPEAYNFQHSQYPKSAGSGLYLSAVVVHFQGNRKPWHPCFSRTKPAKEYFRASLELGLPAWRPGLVSFLLACWKRKSPLIGYRLQQMRKFLQAAVSRG